MEFAISHTETYTTVLWMAGTLHCYSVVAQNTSVVPPLEEEPGTVKKNMMQFLMASRTPTWTNENVTLNTKLFIYF